MKTNTKAQNTTSQLSTEEYAKAMNFVGHSLLGALSQSVQQLPAELRSNKVVAQALGAFLANVFKKQFPQDQDLRQQMSESVSKLVQLHLDAMA